MLKAKQMARATIVGSKEYLEETIETLHKLNAIHINDFTEERSGFKIGYPLKRAASASEKLLKIRSISNLLGIGNITISEKFESKKLFEKTDKELDELEQRVNRTVEKKGEIEGKLEDIKRVLEEIQPIMNEVGEEYKKYDMRELAPLLVSSELEEKIVGILQFDEFSEDKINSLTFTKKLVMISKKLEKEKEKEEKKLDDIKAKYTSFILASEELLSIEVEKAEAPLRFAETDHFFIIDCFVPTKRFEDVKKGIREVHESILVENLEEEEEEPVSLENPKLSKPFQPFVEAFATPRYKEIDPTIIISITFPFFFGFMLGDIGYGLVIIALVLLGITKKLFTVFAMEGVSKQLNKVLLYSAISSIIFGIIYGEFFGFMMFSTHEHTGFLFPAIHYGQYHLCNLLFGVSLHLPIDRFEDVALLLVLTSLIGIAHLYLGWFLGFGNKVKMEGIKQALFEKGGWILLLTGGFILCIQAVPSIMFGGVFSFSTTTVIGAILLLIGLLLVIKGEGFTAIVEIPTFLLSNTLSYTRLFAIGASSAGIAFAFNGMAIDFFNSGGAMGIGLAVAILIMGHVINILLGLMGPTLHSLRLHYVEFFTKFYEGGGTTYRPFGRGRRYTKV